MTALIAMFLLLQNPNADSTIAKIAIDQNLNGQIDLSLPFVDESGHNVTLHDYFLKKPVILTPVYFACPMLCSELLNGLVRALRVMPYTAGAEFEIVTFSIDSHEGAGLAAGKKEHYVHDYDRPLAATGWHFLTGKQASIDALTRQIGFRYTYDPDTQQWAHASAILVLTADGRISQYWNGIEYDPGDLKLSLVQASKGKVGSIVDHILLYCYEYDPSRGKYSLAIMRIVRIAGLATVLLIALFTIQTRTRS